MKELLTNVRFLCFNTIYTIRVLRLYDFTQHVTCNNAKSRYTISVAGRRICERYCPKIVKIGVFCYKRNTISVLYVLFSVIKF